MRWAFLEGLAGKDPDLWRKLGVGSAFALLLGAIGVLTYLNFFAPPPSADSPHSLPTGAASLRPDSPGSGGADTSGAAAPASIDRVTLLFGANDGESLVREYRSLSVSGGSARRARTALEEMLSGSHSGLPSAVPEGTRIREVYVTPDRIVVVDLSAEVRNNHSGGASEELHTIEAIVGTVLANVPSVKGVRILIEGRDERTLAGHVDLSRPLVVNLSRVAPPSAE